jgi:nucleotide-binding universal stress UspA family protein
MTSPAAGTGTWAGGRQAQRPGAAGPAPLTTSLFNTHAGIMSYMAPCRVIVGVGDLEDGVRPLAWALAEARRRGAQLHAIRTWREPSQPAPLSADWRDTLEQAAEQTLVDALRLVTGGVAPDFSCRLIARQGFSSDVLLAYADRDDDLLVLGASRRGLWGLFGQRTVAECVRKAGCPVIVVPPVALAPTLPVRKLMRELRRDLRQLEQAGA